jgi:hypothetical protein
MIKAPSSQNKRKKLQFDQFPRKPNFSWDIVEKMRFDAKLVEVPRWKRSILELGKLSFTKR